MRIYLDNCCYNRPYDDQSQLKIQMETQAKLAIQRLIRTGKLELASSYILESENAENPYSWKRTDIKAFLHDFATVFVDERNNDAIQKMADSITLTGVKLMDACHVACAVLAGCDAFLTTDKRLLRYHTDAIRIVNPVVFYMEEEDQA